VVATPEPPPAVPTPTPTAPPEPPAALDGASIAKQTKHGAFDVLGYLPAARAAAQDHVKTAELTRIEIASVSAKGAAAAKVSYSFRAADKAGTCAALVSIDGKDGTYQPDPASGACSFPLVRPPHCTPAELWKRARKAHVPKTAREAQLTYRAASALDEDHTGPGVWTFSAGDFEEDIPDDCAAR
jgi:hypothetical protein